MSRRRETPPPAFIQKLSPWQIRVGGVLIGVAMYYACYRFFIWNSTRIIYDATHPKPPAAAPR